MENKKYELTEETKNIYAHTLHRIRALRDFNNVKTGDLGGWIEKEENLSHEGNAWVYRDAHVYGHAHISEDAQVFGNACVYGYACVYGNAHIYGDAHISGDACVHGHAHVYGYAQIYEGSWVYGDVCVYGYAHIYGYAHVYGDAWVYGYACVYRNARISGDTCIEHGNIIWDVSSSKDILSIGPIGSRNDYTTFIRTDKGIMVSTGCFKGTIKEFEEAVKKTHGDNEYGNTYRAAIKFVQNLFYPK